MEFFKKTLDPVIALMAIAVLDVFLFLIVGAWTVGGGETMMTGLIAKLFMGDALDRLPVAVDVALLAPGPVRQLERPVPQRPGQRVAQVLDGAALVEALDELGHGAGPGVPAAREPQQERVG